MSFTINDLAAIERAIAMGELTVEIEGHRVTYRSISDLLSAKSHIEGSLSAAGLLDRSPRYSLAKFFRDERDNV